MRNQVLIGDALAQLSQLADDTVQCCVTSPPYFGLRDYGVEGQIGLEADHRSYVDRLTAVFREVRRVLRSDGTLWLNLGDCYAHDGKWGGSTGGRHARKLHGRSNTGRVEHDTGLKPKDLMMIPARVALALQADGWYLRADIIWAKGNPMPESVGDRPTRSHEYVFLLTKASSYFYDADAIREPHKGIVRGNHDGMRDQLPKSRIPGQTPQNDRAGNHPLGRNKRSVWTINPRPYRGAHFAVMPEELVRLCVRAGSAVDSLVLDPFAGSGTTLAVACALGRDYLGIELNPAFLPLIEERLEQAREIRSDHEMFAFSRGHDVSF